MDSEIIQINEKEALEGSFHFSSENTVNYRVNNKNYHAEIIPSDNPKEIHVRINGNTYSVNIISDLDILISKMGLNKIKKPNAGNVISPMPGLVIELFVKVGDQVDEDQALVILEAMKMENIIKASGAGEIKAIHISKADKVDKGQLMIEIVPKI